MRNVHIDYRSPDHGFQTASLLAKDAAMENKMKAPDHCDLAPQQRAG